MKTQIKYSSKELKDNKFSDLIRKEDKKQREDWIEMQWIFQELMKSSTEFKKFK